MKYFIITVDTEGDNLWDWKEGNPITTENAVFIPRFQDLCESYSFYPTYLINYEMAIDKRWISFAKNKQNSGLCELGMHLHAWNTPPIVELENKWGGNPYITEYSLEIIQAKVQTMKEVLSSNFECDISSNRSGRWAINEAYLKILQECGIKCDCSITPGLDLSNIPGRTKKCGNNYKKYKHQAFEIIDGLIEVPMTTMISRMPLDISFKSCMKAVIKGESLWLRPIMDEKRLKYLCDSIIGKSDYVEFMIHSSELMPGGSPYFNNSDAVDMLYNRINWLFTYLKNKGFVGVTLFDYCMAWRRNNDVNN